MPSQKTTKPKLGMGVTEQMYSDRHAYTIVRVVSERRVEIQQDKAIRTDKRGYYTEAQDYRYEPNPEGPKRTISRRKDGSWRTSGKNDGAYYILDHRREYRDPSF